MEHGGAPGLVEDVQGVVPPPGHQGVPMRERAGHGDISGRDIPGARARGGQIMRRQQMPPRRFALPDTAAADVEDDVMELSTGRGGGGNSGAEDFGMLANGDRLRQTDPEDAFGEDDGEEEYGGGEDFEEDEGGFGTPGAGFKEPRPDDFGLDADIQEQADRIRQVGL